jgi:hypothetical protein
MTEENPYTHVPEKMLPHVKNYVENGILPGDFLAALLENNLVNAWGQADESNRERLQEWVWWLKNYAPRECWGSKEKVIGWLNKKSNERNRR